MSTKLSQKLERINASVARIREKTNLPNAVIEDVATAIETLEVPTGSIAITENGTVDVTNYAQAEVNVPGLVPAGSITITENGSVDVTNYAEAVVDVAGGETTKSNIYKVATIAERDAITDMVEGDMCVVHTSSIANMQVTDSVTSITFPATVVLPEAFTGNAWVSLRDADMTFDVMVDLAQTRMRCDIMADDYISISYTSTDGITYTREDSYAETIEFSSPVSCVYPEEWNDVLGYFLQVGGIEFGGLFTYSDDAWGYSKIGISTTADYVYADKNVYTDAGNLIGTLATNSINTFDDTDAFVFSKIQKHYDNMDIIVAPANSSSLYNGSKLYVLPMKSDGTPL